MMACHQRAIHVCIVVVVTVVLARAAPRRQQRHLEPCLSTDCPQKDDRIRKQSTNSDDQQHPGVNDVTEKHIRQSDVDNGTVDNPSESPDPEVAVHGVSHAHNHNSRDTGDTQRINHVLPDQEVALHGGQDVHSTEENPDDHEGEIPAHGTDVDPDVMLHDSDSQHAHLHSDNEASSGLLPSPDTPNPDWQVTGHEHHTRLGVARDEEKDDFIAWKAETESNFAATPPPADGNWLWRGFSWPFLSDSIEDDETIMKRRYLTRGEDTNSNGEVRKLDTEA